LRSSVCRAMTSARFGGAGGDCWEPLAWSGRKPFGLSRVAPTIWNKGDVHYYQPLLTPIFRLYDMTERICKWWDIFTLLRTRKVNGMSRIILITAKAEIRWIFRILDEHYHKALKDTILKITTRYTSLNKQHIHCICVFKDGLCMHVLFDLTTKNNCRIASDLRG
jgi:hypothetical protein